MNLVVSTIITIILGAGRELLNHAHMQQHSEDHH